MISRTIDSGTANDCCWRRTTNTGMMARVKGSLMRNVVPTPGCD
jgi:hypothetical protein